MRRRGRRRRRRKWRCRWRRRSHRQATRPSFLLSAPSFHLSVQLRFDLSRTNGHGCYNAMLSSRSFLHGPACFDTLHLRRSTVSFHCSKGKCSRTVTCLSYDYAMRLHFADHLICSMAKSDRCIPLRCIIDSIINNFYNDRILKVGSSVFLKTVTALRQHNP